jgi:hypothetical protein
MAEVVCFPLHRRQKLIRELRRKRTTNERRYALRRTAAALERIGIEPTTIDSQIRAVSLMACRQIWTYRPNGDAA